MAVTVTLSIPPCIAQEPAVEMDVHHVYETGEMVATPLRTLPLRVGGESSITLHCRMALVIRRGTRDRLPIDITHGDRAMTRGLLLTQICLAGPGEPATELMRLRVQPGERVMIAVERADVLLIREIEEPA